MSNFCYGNETGKTPYHYTLCGLDDVYLTSGYELTSTEYGDGVVVKNMDGLHRAIGEFLATRKKALSGKEIRFLRGQLGLTQAGLGGVLRVADQTVARWEKQEVEIPGPAELLVRVIYLGHLKKAINVPRLVERLRSIDAPTHDRQLFSSTRRGWEALAA